MIIIKALMFSFRFGDVIRLIGEEQRGIESAGTVDSTGMIIIYGNPENH